MVRLLLDNSINVFITIIQVSTKIDTQNEKFSSTRIYQCCPRKFTFYVHKKFATLSNRNSQQQNYTLPTLDHLGWGVVTTITRLGPILLHNLWEVMTSSAEVVFKAFKIDTRYAIHCQALYQSHAICGNISISVYVSVSFRRTYCEKLLYVSMQ